ncbi:NAD(P)/FAD-dependent oxidoreductase [Polaromonas naphthalenivorans]|uniref:Geranylgeranyl reductase n=1 Tax=Polaromonas naphthalenivorans (strain CJ2) TaxID=365044 RepID=A1VLY0_POLNA|nr:NAD(P)/FAD-dependent oxidoreductase [Polaromonas naphthalenivorans]ABM36658.1 geranylgeranyl reductase [Polaromonas naphthalenivorans CJ2]
MNSSIELLPKTCDVLVIGAGPSGSAAAFTLAKTGLDVVLIDQHAFPRDKICGDGLIPDAHKALDRLGVLDEVMRQAHSSEFLSCISPRGGRIDVAGTLAVLPRKQLDDIVCKAAVAAGARMFAPVRFTAPIEENGKVTGARLAQSGHECELRATWVILATGAVPQALMAAGMAERHTPSAIAMRCYIKNDAMASRIDKLEVIWHKALAPGYGWIFPCGNGVFNVGVGILAAPDDPAGKRDTSQGKAGTANLRQMFEALGTLSEPARELMAGGTRLSPLKGAPLRCSLQGAQLSRPGLLVTGEAAGSTYAFSGEGIGKALETGILAAEAILQGEGEAQVRAHYQSRIEALRPRFALYERANLVNKYPWLADLLIWRARKSARLQQRLSGVLNETSNPGSLFTVKGFVRLFTE